jgi:hypothetical protein
MNNPRKYWFCVRSNGMGWRPATWQGLASLIVYVALIPLLVAVSKIEAERWISLAGIPALTAALLCLCKWKGEPLRRTW